MTKEQIVVWGSVGAFAVAAGALAFFLYGALDAKSTRADELEEQRAQFQRYNSAAVFPSRKSIAGVATNVALLAKWREDARALAARGDKAFGEESPAGFKQRLQSEVRRLSALPGSAEGGHIAVAGFLFGFDKYLGENGAMPQTAEVPVLAVQLDAVTHLVETFAAAGALQVKAVKRQAPKVEEAQDEKPRKNAKKAKGKKAADEADEPAVSVQRYGFEIDVRPAGFVKVLNALNSDARFMTVKDFAFRETADIIREKMNAVAAAKEAAAQQQASSSSSRRRRRGAAVAEETPEQKPAEMDALVVDPELDAPIQVNMTVEVYDFGTASAQKKEQ